VQEIEFQKLMWIQRSHTKCRQDAEFLKASEYGNSEGRHHEYGNLMKGCGYGDPTRKVT